MPNALISYEELAELIEKKPDNFILLDATFVLPNTPVDPYLLYRNKRIGDAQYFDIEEIADQSASLPHMLPSEEFFAEKVGNMGVTNDSKVVIYGQSGLAMGPARAWWMFRSFGHKDVSILNGSMAHWENQGFPVNSNEPETPAPSSYNAMLNKDMVVDIDQVMDISASQSAPILDARPAERFSGQAEEPRPGMRSGHIPNSQNIQTGSLINPNSGGLKNNEELKEIIANDILETPAPPVMTCGSGVTACVIALACYQLGREDWRIYDGSWSEWGQSNHPVATTKKVMYNINLFF